MRKHNGMRPQDVVLLLKISTLNSTTWHGKDLAAALHISAAEVSDALRRCQYARLLHAGQRTVVRGSLLRFLLYGLPHVFPARPGRLVCGCPTAYSAEPELWQQQEHAQPLVWPTADGPVWGAAVEPLYPGVPAAVRHDPALHRLLALADGLRLGLPAQRETIRSLLKEHLLASGQP